MIPTTIISGAQTGVDQGALYGALLFRGPRNEPEVTGWVPKDFKTEDGEVPADLRSFMRESDVIDYAHRTRLNINLADATLVLHRNKVGRGTQLTMSLARASKKPLLVVNIGSTNNLTPRAWLSTNGKLLDPYPFGRGSADSSFHDFLNMYKPKVLNVAGPRESHDPGIQKHVESFIQNALSLAARA